MNFAEDPAAFDADFTETVTRQDGSTFLAYFDSFDEDQFDVTAARYNLEFWTADAPGIEEGEPLAVAAVSYEVLQPPRRLGDGARSVAFLKAV